MSSPIGHVLIAVLAGRSREAHGKPLWFWLSLAGFAAIAPDLDFLPGLLIGDINRFHHGASHSLGAAAIFGALVALVAGARTESRTRLGLLAAALYASHLVLDLFTVHTRPPTGQPLLWPISSEYFALARPFLYGIRHRAGDGLMSFVLDVMSMHNVSAALREILFVTPLVGLIWLALGRRVGRVARRRVSNLRVHGRTTEVPAPDPGD